MQQLRKLGSRIEPDASVSITLQMNQPCRLCGQQRPLRDSHILPEFMYKPMYASGEHKFFGLGRHPTKPQQIYQKGIREVMLCADCESLFSKHETYASKLLYHGGAGAQFQDLRGFRYYKGINYHQFKLFLLSLVWRMGATNCFELKGLSLGQHEARLRQMLLNQDPGTADDYPCLMGKVLLDGKSLADAVSSPAIGKVGGHSVWSFMAGGFFFSYYVSSHAKPMEVKAAAVTQAGTLIMHQTELPEFKVFYETFQKTFAEVDRREHAGRALSGKVP